MKTVIPTRNSITGKQYDLDSSCFLQPQHGVGPAIQVERADAPRLLHPPRNAEFLPPKFCAIFQALSVKIV